MALKPIRKKTFTRKSDTPARKRPRRKKLTSEELKEIVEEVVAEEQKLEAEEDASQEKDETPQEEEKIEELSFEKIEESHDERSEEHIDVKQGEMNSSADVAPEEEKSDEEEAKEETPAKEEEPNSETTAEESPKEEVTEEASVSEENKEPILVEDREKEKENDSESPFFTNPGSTDSKMSKKSVILLFLTVFILVVAASGAFYYYKFMGGQSLIPEPTPAPTKEITPTPTVEEANLSEYSVDVLNGSGVGGAAGDAADLLTEAGFENVDTGNASAYDFDNTEIAVKKDTPDAVIEAVEKALQDDYTVVISEDNLSESNDYDVVVTVGQKK